MKCPYCEKEMVKGILSGDGREPVTWKAGDKKAGAFDRWVLGMGTVTAAKRTLTAFTIESYYCGNCRKMMFDTDIKGM